MQKVVVDETGNTDEKTVDDDIYNESVRLVVQEEEYQENNSILLVIKLTPKCRRGIFLKD